jgi:hypothetical protein
MLNPNKFDEDCMHEYGRFGWSVRKAKKLEENYRNGKNIYFILRTENML